MNNIDLRVEKTFPIGGPGRQAGVYLDLFNFNNQGVVDNGKRTGVIEGPPERRFGNPNAGSARGSRGWDSGSRSRSSVKARKDGRRPILPSGLSGPSCPSCPSCPVARQTSLPDVGSSRRRH